MIQVGLSYDDKTRSSIMQLKKNHHFVDTNENHTVIEPPSAENRSQPASSLASTDFISSDGHTIHEHPTHHSPARNNRNVNQNTLSAERNTLIRSPPSRMSSPRTKNVSRSFSSSESSSIESLIDSLTVTTVSTKETTNSHCTNDTNRMKRFGDTNTDRIFRKDIQMERASSTGQGHARSCSRPDNWYASGNRSYEYDSDSNTYPFPNSPGNRNQPGQHNSPIMSPAKIPTTPTTPSSRTCMDPAKFMTPQNQGITTTYSDSDHESVDTIPSDAFHQLHLGAAPIKKKTNNPRRFQTNEERDLAIGCVVKNLFSG